MSSVRKYWLRHPVQMRVCCALCLALLPVVLPVMAAILYRSEIIDVVATQYRELWRGMTKGAKG